MAAMPGPSRSARAPAWGADPRLLEEQARERLLDAAEACYAERGPSRTKMTHIAAEAGVHRSTVYSYFPNREAVLAACFLRAVTAVLDGAESCWQTEEPFIDQVVNSCIVGLAIARKSPTMKVLISDDELGRTHRAAEDSQAWRSRLRAGLGERFAIAAAAGDVRADLAPELLAHLVTRICFSLIADPGKPEYGGDEGILRALLTDLITCQHPQRTQSER